MNLDAIVEKVPFFMLGELCTKLKESNLHLSGTRDQDLSIAGSVV